jgi:ABC-type phosphate transport system substrate-binding protein
MKKIAKHALIFFLLLALSPLAMAGVSVIVHKDNPVSSLEKADIAKIFLGKMKAFPDGNPVVPLDQKDDSAIKDGFYTSVVNKPLAQLKAYWSKLIFTGKGQPPKAVTEEEVLTLVSANPNLIGYVDSAKVTPEVKVVYSE